MIYCEFYVAQNSLAQHSGSYETWFGEHSYRTTRASEIIEKESLEILNRLKHAEGMP